MRMRVAVALAGLCALVAQASPAHAQSSARCGAYHAQVKVAIDRNDGAALQRLVGLPAAAQCAPEAQAARAALARLAKPPPPPPRPVVSPPPTPSPPIVRSPQPVVRSPQPVVRSPQPVVRSPQPVVRSPQPDVRSPPPPPAPAADEVAWRNAQRTNSCDGYRGFLSLFSDSLFAAQARSARDRLCTPPAADAPTVRVIEPEMVRIPGGTFMMGSPAGEWGRGEDADSQAGVGGSQVRVTIPAFEVGKYEVTFDEWDACVAGGGCGGYRPNDEGWGRGRRPVVNVSWNDAQAYVRWLNARTGKSYRLLTEAEWEYAARAGTTGRFSNDGGEARLCQVANHLDQSTDSSWRNATCNDGVGKQTAPVGRYAANPFGLHDMHGNVWEWVEDCYRDNLSGQTAAAYTAEGCSYRVIRGGSWDTDPLALHSAFRNSWWLDNRRTEWGFRLARTL